VVEGSYYLETIVKEMKDKGWTQFLSLEEKGGWLVALESNEIQSQIEQVREAEKMRFKAGQQILVGTNRYVAESGLSASVKSKKKMPVASCSPFTPLQTVYLSNDDES
jgi:methylmalonyl-CoA mutase N-terminal domain/subunit